jgi:hypothetical protein
MTDEEHAHEAENTPVTPTEPAGEEIPAPTPDDMENASDDVAALRRESAGYRRKLRAAEAERDRLREALDVRDRADAERLAGQTMSDGRDQWMCGVELAALRDEDGQLSPDLVEAAVAGVLAERPHWRKARAVSFDGGARTTPESPPSFGEALKGAGRP